MSILIGFTALLGVETELPAQKPGSQTIKFPLKKELKVENGRIVKAIDSLPRRRPEEVRKNPILTMEDVARERILRRWEKRQRHKKKFLPRKPFIANVSAYTAAYDETLSGDGITASGVKVKPRRTLACPPEYPFGTKVRFENLGTFVCEDRGGAIKGNKFDVYVVTKKEAFAFGRRYLKAQVVF